LAFLALARIHHPIFQVAAKRAFHGTAESSIYYMRRAPGFAARLVLLESARGSRRSAFRLPAAPGPRLRRPARSPGERSRLAPLRFSPTRRAGPPASPPGSWIARTLRGLLRPRPRWGAAGMRRL